MNTLAAIMTAPELAEVCFLVAFVFFVVEIVLAVVQRATGILVSAGLAALAFGFLAL